MKSAVVLLLASVMLVPLACGGSDSSSSTISDTDAGPTCGTLTTCGTGPTAFCANTATDNANCGACGHACEAGTVCANGACGLTCGALATCGSGASVHCANTGTDNANCGACDHACESGNVCAGGACGLTCGTLTTCGTGASTYCAKTATDNANCGTCGHACDPGTVCANGTCGLTCGALTTCGTGASTYCASTATDNANCGTCGHACDPGTVCANGTCGLTCGALTTCGTGPTAYCASTATDNANCGTCGHACDSGTVCSGGTCGLTCGALTTCGTGANAYCANTSTDNANCGTCGHACAPGEACDNKKCVATTYCSGSRLTATPFAGGSGTRIDPYRICTADQLAKVSTNNKKAFVLETDLDLGGAQISEISLGNGGFFDGQNHVVRNWVDNHELTTSYERAGLFTFVDHAEIRNLGVEGFSMTTTEKGGFAGGVGALVGAAYNSRIVNCHATGGTIDHQSIWYAGILVGWPHDTVFSRCYASGTITAPSSFCGKGGALIGGDGNGYGSTLITDSWAVASPQANTGLAPCFGGLYNYPLVLSSFIKEPNGSFTVYDPAGQITHPANISGGALAPLGFDFNQVWQAAGGPVLKTVLLTDASPALSLTFDGSGALASGTCEPFTISQVTLTGAVINATAALDVAFFSRDPMVIYPSQAACNAGTGSISSVTIPAGQSSVQVYAKLASVQAPPVPAILYAGSPGLVGALLKF